MPVCSEMPWGGPFHEAHGFGRGWRGRGGFGFGGCGRGGFTGWGTGMGPWGLWGHHHPPHHPHHHGPPPHHPPPPHHHHHHGPPPHHHHHHGPPPHHPPHHGPPPHHPPHHGPPHHLHDPCHGGPCGGPRSRFGGPMRGPRGRGGCRGRMGPWRWGPPGMGPRRWHCRPGAFDAPFDDALLMGVFLNFDLPVYSRDGDTGEDVPPADTAPSAPEEEPAAQTNTIRIDTRRFSPDDIRVSFSEGQLRITAIHTDEHGEEVTLRRSAALRPGSKVTAKLGADGYLYIRAEEPAERSVNVEVAEDEEN